MIKSIVVTNYLGESLQMELAKPDDTGILIESITGLGPPKADINSTEVASGDGAVFNSARATSRNIVLTLRLLFNKTVEDVRQKTYKYFPIKKMVSLIVETDNRICGTYGYVETNEPNIFSKEESTQISIICPDPYFYGLDNGGYTSVVFFGVEPLFEFPFSNESLTENMIEFGKIKSRQEENIYYDGDTEVGFIIVMHALGEVRQITIFNTITRERMHLDTDRLAAIMGSGIQEGDEITISTVKGNKYITILRNGIYTNILNALDRNTNWFQLYKGDNRFAYVAEYGAEDLEFRIQYQTLYEGI